MQPLLELREKCRADTQRRIVVDTPAHTVSETIGSLAQSADVVCAQQLSSGNPKDKPDCSDNCSYCCHMRVVATVPEIIRIYTWLNSQDFDGDLEALEKEISDTDRVAHGKDDDAWGIGRHKCPLLIDGNCSVYPARPLDCRAYNSTNKAACRAAMDNYAEWSVPNNSQVQAVYKHAQSGVLAGLESSGFKPRLVELVAALRVVLDDPGTINRWLGGENCFEQAETPADDPEQLAFSSEFALATKAGWVCSDAFREEGEFYLTQAQHKE